MVSMLLVVGFVLGAVVLAANGLIPNRRRSTVTEIERYVSWGRPAVYLLGTLILLIGVSFLFLSAWVGGAFTGLVPMGDGLLATAAGAVLIGSNISSDRRVRRYLERLPVAQEGEALTPVADSPSESRDGPDGVVEPREVVNGGLESRGQRPALKVEAGSRSLPQSPNGKKRRKGGKSKAIPHPSGPAPRGEEEGQMIPAYAHPCPACGKDLPGMVHQCPGCGAEFDWE